MPIIFIIVLGISALTAGGASVYCTEKGHSGYGGEYYKIQNAKGETQGFKIGCIDK